MYDVARRTGPNSGPGGCYSTHPANGTPRFRMDPLRAAELIPSGSWGLLKAICRRPDSVGYFWLWAGVWVT